MFGILFALVPWPPGTARAQTGLGNAETEVALALAREYGEVDPHEHCWKATSHEQNWSVSACLKIAQSFRIATPSGVHIYVLLAGKGDSDCHGCGGLIGLFSFAQSGTRWTMEAKAPAEPDGSYGVPTDPLNFQVIEYGPATWGWLETASHYGQGELEERYLVYLPRNGAFVLAGQIDAQRDNAANCVSETKTYSGGGCLNVALALGVDRSAPATDFWPLLLQAFGIHGGKPVAQHFAASSDAESFRYTVPQELDTVFW